MWNITAMEGDLWLQKTKFAEERSPKRRGKVVSIISKRRCKYCFSVYVLEI
jgi:hypothetical protein